MGTGSPCARHANVPRSALLSSDASLVPPRCRPPQPHPTAPEPSQTLPQLSLPPPDRPSPAPPTAKFLAPAPQPPMRPEGPRCLARGERFHDRRGSLSEPFRGPQTLPRTLLSPSTSRPPNGSRCARHHPSHQNASSLGARPVLRVQQSQRFWGAAIGLRKWQRGACGPGCLELGTGFAWPLACIMRF